MTTTVIIKAHVSPDKAVLVTMHEGTKLVEEFTIQDGETAERYIYDERVITTREFVKPAAI
jgi:hypothetical protein